MAGLRAHDFQLAVVGLDDLPADRQAESQADISRGVERRGNLLAQQFRGVSPGNGGANAPVDERKRD